MSIKLPQASTTKDGIILNAAQTIEGAKTWRTGSSGVAKFASGVVSTLESSGSSNFLEFSSPITASQGILFQRGSSFNGGILYNHSSDRMTFYTANGTARGDVDTNGAWTLGTGSFQTQKHVIQAGTAVNTPVLEIWNGSTNGTSSIKLRGTGTGNADFLKEGSGSFRWKNDVNTVLGQMTNAGDWTFGTSGLNTAHTAYGGLEVIFTGASVGAGSIFAAGNSEKFFFNGSTGASGVTNGESTTNCAMRVRKDAGGTDRSINAAGTVNASGADYAEYMTKDNINDIILPGEVCGIKSNGKLTKLWSESISFVIKSTNPSYVGGDTWFNREKNEGESDQEYANAMESARSAVDRIAFCGQVPCNIAGSFSVGDYVVPYEGEYDSIQVLAVSKSSITLQQYMSSVGQIWKDAGNGVALISVGLK